MLNIKLLSDRYRVEKLGPSDVKRVYELCCNNSLYYHYFPPFVSEQSIVEDMNALPPNKEPDDKYYMGYFEGDRLVAVMDLIMGYPDVDVAYIGFFMTDLSVQNKGIGSGIIEELCAALSCLGIKKVRLGWVRNNPQAEHFWHKNLFVETGDVQETEDYTVVVAERELENSL